MFGDQTPSNIVCWPNILPFGHLVWCGSIVYDKIWRPSIKQLKSFLFSCLIGGVLLVWTAASNTLGVRMRTTLAQWLACVHWYRVFFYVRHLLNILKMANEEKAFWTLQKLRRLRPMKCRVASENKGQARKWNDKERHLLIRPCISRLSSWVIRIISR